MALYGLIPHLCSTTVLLLREGKVIQVRDSIGTVILIEVVIRKILGGALAIMLQNSIYDLLVGFIYFLSALLAVIGVFLVLRGINRLSTSIEAERYVPWYNYRPILMGIWATLLGCFFALFITSMVLTAWESKLLLVIFAFLCLCLSVLSLIRSRKYAALLPPKRKKLKQAQPKDS